MITGKRIETGREGLLELDSAFHIITKVLTSHPIIERKDRDQVVIAETMARHLLNFAGDGDGIGDWMS